jgi:excisionase family DNA binding protein
MEAKHELRRALDALQAAATAIEEQPDAEEAASRLMTAADIAEYLAVKRSWVYDNYKLLNIPHMFVGKKVRFRQSEIDQWLDSRRGGVSVEPHTKNTVRQVQGSLGRPGNWS